MKLTLHGHDDRYAVEQLQLSLFPDNTEGEAVSSLHRGKVWLTAVTKITVNGVTATATRRIKAADETVRLRRRALQQSYYPRKSLPSICWRAAHPSPQTSCCGMYITSPMTGAGWPLTAQSPRFGR